MNLFFVIIFVSVAFEGMIIVKEQYLHVLKNKNYLKLFIADALSRFGDSLDSILMTILAYELTHSASWSALVFTLNRIPTLFIQPFAGVFVEKRNKKVIMVISDMMRVLLVGFLFIQYLTSSLTSISLLIVTFCVSLVEAFRQPTSQPILLHILDKETLEVGTSLRQSMSQISELIGLGVSGILISTLGYGIILVIDLLMFMISAFMISLMRIKETDVPSQESFIKEFKEGLSVVFRYPVIKSLIILAAFMNAIMTPYYSLQVPLVNEVLHSSSTMISLMSATMSMGVILGSMLYPIIKDKMNMRIMLYVCSFMVSGTYLLSCLFGYLKLPPLALSISIALLFFVLGLSVAIVNMYANIELLKTIPKQYISRVMALMIALCSSVTPLVSFLMTIATNYLFVGYIFILTALINIVGIMLIMKRLQIDHTCTDKH